jgi:hypothetical protein
MAMECKYGLMALVMKGIGSTIRHVGKVNSGMLMETFLKVSGKMTKLMDMAFIFT